MQINVVITIYEFLTGLLYSSVIIKKKLNKIDKY